MGRTGARLPETPAAVVWAWSESETETAVISPLKSEMSATSLLARTAFPPWSRVGADRKSSFGPVLPKTTRRGIDGLDDDLARTEYSQFRGRSLSYVRALTHLRSILAGAERVGPIVNGLDRVWAKREFHTYFARPFLILASLRAEALASSDHPLATGFATRDPDPSTVTREAIVSAMSQDRIGPNRGPTGTALGCRSRRMSTYACAWDLT